MRVDLKGEIRLFVVSDMTILRMTVSRMDMRVDPPEIARGLVIHPPRNIHKTLLDALATAEESSDLCIECYCPYRRLMCMEMVLHNNIGVDVVHLL